MLLDPLQLGSSLLDQRGMQRGDRQNVTTVVQVFPRFRWNYHRPVLRGQFRETVGTGLHEFKKFVGGFQKHRRVVAASVLLAQVKRAGRCDQQFDQFCPELQTFSRSQTDALWQAGQFARRPHRLCSVQVVQASLFRFHTFRHDDGRASVGGLEFFEFRTDQQIISNAATVVGQKAPGILAKQFVQDRLERTITDLKRRETERLQRPAHGGFAACIPAARFVLRINEFRYGIGQRTAKSILDHTANL